MSSRIGPLRPRAYFHESRGHRSRDFVRVQTEVVLVLTFRPALGCSWAPVAFLPNAPWGVPVLETRDLDFYGAYRLFGFCEGKYGEERNARSLPVFADVARFSKGRRKTILEKTECSQAGESLPSCKLARDWARK
ncbi:unnamed protein product [Ixodes pacificus]